MLYIYFFNYLLFSIFFNMPQFHDNIKCKVMFWNKTLHQVSFQGCFNIQYQYVMFSLSLYQLALFICFKYISFYIPCFNHVIKQNAIFLDFLTLFKIFSIFNFNITCFHCHYIDLYHSQFFHMYLLLVVLIIVIGHSS